MLSIYIPTRMAAIVDTHVSHAHIKDKPGVVTPVSSVKNVTTNMLRPNNYSRCVILNDLAVPPNALAANIESYNKGLQTRINHEYKPQGSTVFLLGTPEPLEVNASLSLPVSPHILTQKLLSISNNKTCKFSTKTNGYVQDSKAMFNLR